MAFITINETVRTTATPLVTLPVAVGRNRSVQITNADSATIAIGGPNVTVSGATIGKVLAVNGTIQYWLDGGDTIYAVSAAGTGTGKVIIQYSA